ncbi:MAG: sugar transferase [Armatimonadota bacterium]
MESTAVLDDRRGYEFAKRALDIVGASILLTVLSIPAAIVAVLIKVDDPGPVMFKQIRVGRFGRRFTIYKFRTMISNAEKMQQEMDKYNEAGGAYFKMKNDPRVTKVGIVLRKLSLDEIPQFINVLTGDMSLVGPRPLPITGYEEEEWYVRKVSVPPGMTGLWQISGRSDLSGEQAAGLDLEYVKRRGMWFDLRLMLMTIPAVLFRKGAA